MQEHKLKLSPNANQNVDATSEWFAEIDAKGPGSVADHGHHVCNDDVWRRCGFAEAADHSFTIHAG